MSLAFGQGAKTTVKTKTTVKAGAGKMVKQTKTTMHTGQARAAMARHHGRMMGMRRTGQARAMMARHHGRMAMKGSMHRMRRHHRHHKMTADQREDMMEHAKMRSHRRHRMMKMAHHRMAMKAKAGK